MSVDTNPQEIPTGETVSGETTVYVAHEEQEQGDMGPFYVAYTDSEQSRRYGYVCGACGSDAVSMDTMGRLACGECANRRGATEWDAAYL